MTSHEDDWMSDMTYLYRVPDYRCPQCPAGLAEIHRGELIEARSGESQILLLECPRGHTTPATAQPEYAELFYLK
jgi:hypothetical protein